MRPVAVLGNLSLDVVDGGPPRPGGGPFYAARALRALDRPARVVTKLREDDRKLLLHPLLALGVPVHWRPAGTTAAFRLEYGQDGERRLSVQAPGPVWTVEDVHGWVGEALAGVRWLQVAPLARPELPAATLAELARGGRRLLLDGQGLVRPGTLGSVRLDAAYDPDVLRHATVLKLAEDEALALLGRVDGTRLAELGVPEVVVTLGARGAVVWSGAGLERVAVHEVGGRVDPTGAGDAFAAAYLAARDAGDRPGGAAHKASALVAAMLEGRA